MGDEREQQIRAAIEEGWEGWFTGYHGSMDVTAARLAYEAGWRQQEASFRALLADQDRGIDALAAATALEDELANLRGLLLQAATALLSAMNGGPVDDSVLNDIEAALPQGLAREATDADR